MRLSDHPRLSRLRREFDWIDGLASDSVDTRFGTAWGPWIQGLNQCEQAAVRDYQHIGRWQKFIPGPSQDAKAADQLDGALRRARAPENTILWRGKDHDVGHPHAKLAVGQVLDIGEGFLSCSGIEAVALVHANAGDPTVRADRVLYEFLVPAGTPVAYVEPLQPPSGAPGINEVEFLFPRGTRWTVLHVADTTKARTPTAWSLYGHGIKASVRRLQLLPTSISPIRRRWLRIPPPVT